MNSTHDPVMMKSRRIGFLAMVMLAVWAAGVFDAIALSERMNAEIEEKAVQNTIFPGVDVRHYTFSMGVIALHAEDQGRKPMQGDSLVLVSQPWGIVTQYYEIDLGSGGVTVIPGTHQQAEIWTFILSPEKLAELVSILDSEEFAELPQENMQIGMDGCHLFVDFRFKDKHLWVLYWDPIPELLASPFNLLWKECDKAAFALKKGPYKDFISSD